MIYNNIDVAIILPCYNEEKTIEKVINDIRALGYNDIFVINNNSTDRSKEIALNNRCIVIDETRQGKGNAIRKAFTDINANVYVMIDSDDTYDVSSLENMISLVKNEDYDMVIGDRLSTSYYTENKRPMHNFGNNMVRWTINKIFKGKVTDILTGYRVLSRRFVKTFPIMSDGFQIETEMTIHLLDNRYKYICIPCGYKDRQEGSVSKLNTYRDGFKVIGMMYNLYKEYKPKQYYDILSIILAIISTVFIVPVLKDYIATGLVLRFPTLIACCFVYLMSIQLYCIGEILNQRRNSDKKVLEMEIIKEATNKNM